jgi:hypothetical protein
VLELERDSKRETKEKGKTGKCIRGGIKGEKNLGE